MESSHMQTMGMLLLLAWDIWKVPERTSQHRIAVAPAPGLPVVEASRNSALEKKWKGEKFMRCLKLKNENCI